MGPAILISCANIYVSTVVNNPRSTFICPEDIGSGKWTPSLQWVGLALDCIALTAVRNLVSSTRQDRIGSDSIAELLVGSILLVRLLTVNKIML